MKNVRQNKIRQNQIIIKNFINSNMGKLNNLDSLKDSEIRDLYKKYIDIRLEIILKSNEISDLIFLNYKDLVIKTVTQISLELNEKSLRSVADKIESKRKDLKDNEIMQITYEPKLEDCDCDEDDYDINDEVFYFDDYLNNEITLFITIYKFHDPLKTNSMDIEEIKDILKYLKLGH